MSVIVDVRGVKDTNHRFTVVHPLDDAPEAKCDPRGLGKMPMSGAVKLSLFSLRGYLIGMILMVGYRVCSLAGVFGPHVH